MKITTFEPWSIDTSGKLIITQMDDFAVLCKDDKLTISVSLKAFGEGTFSKSLIDFIEMATSLRYGKFIKEVTELADNHISQNGFVNERIALNELCHGLYLEYAQSTDPSAIQLTGQPHIDVVIIDAHAVYQAFLAEAKRLVSSTSYRFNIDMFINRAEANINFIFSEFVDVYYRVYQSQSPTVGKPAHDSK